jgi:hypothetical protein
MTLELSHKLDRCLKPQHLAYLQRFADVKHMKRDIHLALKLADPLREAVNLPIGEQGCYFTGGLGNLGQESDNSVISRSAPPIGMPGLWCQWAPSTDGRYLNWIGDPDKLYNYTKWLDYLLSHFLCPWGYKLNTQAVADKEESPRVNIVLPDYRGRLFEPNIYARKMNFEN